MSHHATNWAIQQRGLKPAAKIVLWHLADCHNPSQGCFPSQEYLAFHCEMSRSTVNLQLEKLEKSGLIKRISARDEKTRKQLPTRYILGCESIQKDGETVSENRTRNEPKTVSEKCEIPCPKNDESRVRKSDSNPVREPVKETLSGENASEEGERENFEDEDLKKEDLEKIPTRRELEKRVKRLGQNHPGFVDQNTGWAVDRFSELDEAERIQAEERHCCYMKVSKNPVALGCYFRDRKFDEVLGECRCSGSPTVSRIALNRLGKAWMAYRFWVFDNFKAGNVNMRNVGMTINNSIFFLNDAESKRWPFIVWADRTSDAVLPDDHGPIEFDSYVQVQKDSDDLRAWEAWHYARDLPWFEIPDFAQYVWFPQKHPSGFELKNIKPVHSINSEIEGKDDYQAL